ncbi:unnamed protein product [Rotaria sp. Silwood1]|nr:unnamed protein product [Rotaria sp. Silwood1]CAF1592168.1 unnamed protein product [Rotaria sp. Silwood1]
MISHLSVVNYNKTFQLYENNIITITILPQFSIVNQNEIDSSFMYTQLLKEILIEMKYDVTAKKQFIDYIHNFYANNEIQLNTINEFQHTYEHYSPIWCGLLSFNNFLSTSTEKSISLIFANSSRSDSNLVQILFEIEINTRTSSVSFASLDHISFYGNNEKEIFFSMHTIFRIDEINQTNNRFWNVKLTMTNDNDEQLKCLTKYIRNEIGGETEYHRLD